MFICIFEMWINKWQDGKLLWCILFWKGTSWDNSFINLINPLYEKDSETNGAYSLHQNIKNTEMLDIEILIFDVFKFKTNSFCFLSVLFLLLMFFTIPYCNNSNLVKKKIYCMILDTTKNSKVLYRSFQLLIFKICIDKDKYF